MKHEHNDDASRQRQPQGLTWGGVFWAVLAANMISLAVVIALLIVLGLVGLFQGMRHWA